MARTRWLFAFFMSIAACGGKVVGESSGSGGTPGAGGTAGKDADASAGGTSVGGAAGTTTKGGAAGVANGGAAGGALGGAAGSTGQGGTAGAAFIECEKDWDCALQSDCCVCAAISPTDPPPPLCPSDCYIDECGSLGIPSGHTPACRVGQCIVGTDCDPSHAFCNAIPPSCDAGELPIVIQGCWGGCVASSQCLSVPSCDSCFQAGQLCVNHSYSKDEYHCVPIPVACQGALSSSCLCPLTCPNWNFCSVVPGTARVQCDYI